MVRTTQDTPTLKRRARSYVNFLSSRILPPGGPADYLKRIHTFEAPTQSHSKEGLGVARVSSADTLMTQILRTRSTTRRSERRLRQSAGGPQKATLEGSHPRAKRTAQCPYLTRTDVRYHHRSEPVPNFPKKATFLIRQPAQHRPKVVQKACFSLINPQEQHRPPCFFVCMEPLPQDTPTLKRRARGYR